MTFSPTPPTKPGFYACRASGVLPGVWVESVWQDSEFGLSVRGSDGRPLPVAGFQRREWCLLLPADEVVTREELRKHRHELFCIKHADDTSWNDGSCPVCQRDSMITREEHAREVEAAFVEGQECGPDFGSWERSRAARVARGEKG